ncbi:hypothetical protein J6590_073878, partial [Homalodisca vitripennis]
EAVISTREIAGVTGSSRFPGPSVNFQSHAGPVVPKVYDLGRPFDRVLRRECEAYSAVPSPGLYCPAPAVRSGENLKVKCLRPIKPSTPGKRVKNEGRVKTTSDRKLALQDSPQTIRRALSCRSKTLLKTRSLQVPKTFTVHEEGLKETKIYQPDKT